jgi:nucleoside-diphosphate-sugar epimerase
MYTSSPSVVFDGVPDIINGVESLPYPDKHNDVYSEMKAEAMVLRSNGREGLLTCALRPSIIFGHGHKSLIPLIIAAGKCYFITNMEPIKFWEFSSLIGIPKALHPHSCEPGDAHCLGG